MDFVKLQVNNNYLVKNVINKSQGTYCSYHVKEKVQKMNKRMVLNDNYGLSHIAMIKPDELHQNLSRGQGQGIRHIPDKYVEKDKANPHKPEVIINPIGRGVGAMYFKQVQGQGVKDSAESLLLKHRKRISSISAENLLLQNKKMASFYHPNSHQLYQKEDENCNTIEDSEEEICIIDEDKTTNTAKVMEKSNQKNEISEEQKLYIQKKIN